MNRQTKQQDRTYASPTDASRPYLTPDEVNPSVTTIAVTLDEFGAIVQAADVMRNVQFRIKEELQQRIDRFVELRRVDENRRIDLNRDFNNSQKEFRQYAEFVSSILTPAQRRKVAKWRNRNVDNIKNLPKTHGR